MTSLDLDRARRRSPRRAEAGPSHEEIARDGGPSHRRVDDDDVRWHVATMGRGPTCLLIHGTGASSDSYRALMNELAPRFSLVAPDLPGHARTRAPPSFEPTVERMARGLAGLLARLEVAPQLVVGHSAGAAVALQMLLDRSIAPRRIVGLGSALLPLPGTTRQILAPAASLLAGSRVAGLVASLAGRRPTVERLLASTGSRLDPEGVRHYQRLAAQREHVAGVLSMMACWNLEPLFARLPEIRQDVLLLAGREDRSVPVAQQRRAASRIPGARLVVVPDAGHLLHEERPQQVAELMVRDLTETPERHPS